MESQPTSTHEAHVQTVAAVEIIGVPTDGIEPGRPLTISVRFPEGTEYVCVEFDYDNEDILVRPAKGGKAGKRFEIHFKGAETLTQDYVIEVEAIEKERYESFDVVCSNNEGVEVLRQHHRIHLIVEPEKVQWVRQIVLWLKRLFSQHPKLIIPAILVGILVLIWWLAGTEKIASFAIGLVRKPDPKHFVFLPPEPEGIATRKVMEVGFRAWEDIKKPVSSSWSPGRDWALVQDPDPSIRRAILVKGNDIGVFGAPNPEESIYDFNILIKILYLNNQRSAKWLLRVRNDRKDYYQFTLTFPTADSGATLAGEAYKGGELYQKAGGSATLFPTTLPPVTNLLPLSEGDVVNVLINASGFDFEHTINVDCKYEDSPNLQVRPLVWRHNDAGGPRYRYGAIGFKSPSANEETKIQYIQINTAE